MKKHSWPGNDPTCTDCLSAEPYHAFLDRVPYKTSETWETTFPRLACLAKGCTAILIIWRIIPCACY